MIGNDLRKKRKKKKKKSLSYTQAPEPPYLGFPHIPQDPHQQDSIF